MRASGNPLSGNKASRTLGLPRTAVSITIATCRLFCVEAILTAKDPALFCAYLKAKQRREGLVASMAGFMAMSVSLTHWSPNRPSDDLQTSYWPHGAALRSCDSGSDAADDGPWPHWLASPLVCHRPVHRCRLRDQYRRFGVRRFCAAWA